MSDTPLVITSVEQAVAAIQVAEIEFQALRRDERRYERDYPDASPTEVLDWFFSHHGKSWRLHYDVLCAAEQFLAQHHVDSLLAACPSLRTWLDRAVKGTDPLARAAAWELAAVEWQLRGDTTKSADARAKAEQARLALAPSATAGERAA